MGTAIKHPVPDRIKLSFVIFDIQSLWHLVLSVRMPWCQKWRLNPVRHSMPYTCSCTHMATVGVKGLMFDRFCAFSISDFIMMIWPSVVSIWSLKTRRSSHNYALIHCINNIVLWYISRNTQISILYTQTTCKNYMWFAGCWQQTSIKQEVDRTTRYRDNVIWNLQDGGLYDVMTDVIVWIK